MLSLVVVGCAASAPESLERTLGENAPPPAVVVAPPVAPAAAAAVVKKFDSATVREPAVVLSSDVTVEQIERVRQADRRARRTLMLLGLQGRHPTKAALDQARAAVKGLEDALAP